MHARARLAVGISFVLFSVVGASFVIAYWADRSFGWATGRAALYIVVIGCVHVIGYLLYVGQNQTLGNDSESGQDSLDLAEPYWPAIKDGVIVQTVLGVATALLLDGGRSLQFFTVAFICQWSVALMIVIRRKQTPTKIDLFFLRWGILILLVATGLVAPTVWRIIGESHLSGWERLWSD
jgi:hypothetical protein